MPTGLKREGCCIWCLADKRRLTQDLECMKERAEAAEGKLDIILRENAGESGSDLAAEYGGTGWEKDPAVSTTRKLRRELRKAADQRCTREHVKSGRDYRHHD
jgi:hypothetical protein